MSEITSSVVSSTLPPSVPRSASTFPSQFNLEDLSQCPDGLRFLADAGSFYVTVDLDWVYVLENLDAQTSVLHGDRVYDVPKSRFWKCGLYVTGRHMGGFEVQISDSKSHPMMTITRKTSASYWFGWFLCCGDFGNKINIAFADGTQLGTVAQKFGIPKVHYDVMDNTGKTVMKIYPPLIGSLNGCNPNVTFKVKFTDGSQVGDKGKGSSKTVIKKTYSGCFYEVFTDSRNYQLEFPVDLPFQMKALLLSSVFLLHPIYFERG